MTKNFYFALQLFFILNFKLTLVQNIFFCLGLVGQEPPRGGAWKHYMANTRLDNVRSLKYLLSLFACCLLCSNAYDMLNIIFIKCFLVSVCQEKLLNFVDWKQIFILGLIYFQICTRLLYRASSPLASSGLRPSILSLMEHLDKFFLLVETGHTNRWIHPWPVH